VLERATTSIEPPRIHELDDAISARAEGSYLVSGADLIRWAEDAAQLRAAVVAERQACRGIVEDHLRLMLRERRADPVLLVRGMLARIAARSGDAPQSYRR
jgi:hypothetical protein